MPSLENQLRYYAIGFNLPSSGTNANCGQTSNQDCHQLCFNQAQCSNSPTPCTNSSSNQGVALASTALPSNVDFYNDPTGTLSAYPSSISATDFEITAATDESQLSKNDLDEKLEPSAYAAQFRIFAIGPSGAPYEKTGSAMCTCCCRVNVSLIQTKTIAMAPYDTCSIACDNLTHSGPQACTVGTCSSGQ
jgi:hypothetical protein